MTGRPEPVAGHEAGGRLAAVVADERLAPLWVAAHRRLETTGGDAPNAAVHLAELTDEQRSAVDRLLGTRSRGRTVRVSLGRLDDVLQARVGCSLTDAVSVAVGPVRNRPGERAARTEQVSALWDRLSSHRALVRHPDLGDWLDRLRATGSWRRLDDPGGRLGGVLDVMARLPLVDRQGRSRLAAEVLGDAHALDDIAPTGRLAVSALAYLAGLDGPVRAAERRGLWSEQGVVSDETSSTVLTLGLRPDPNGPLTTAARQWADGHVPLPLPLAAVQSEQWRLRRGAVVWVCENPSVLAAAAGLAVTVVCLEGRPSVAAILLLRSLVEGEARLRYHGDFGSGGISIANQVIGDVGAEPWRFGTEDHRAAIERAAATAVTPRRLRGPVPAARWDAELAPAIERSGVEIEEELVLDLLLDDLRQSASSS